MVDTFNIIRVDDRWTIEIECLNDTQGRFKLYDREACIESIICTNTEIEIYSVVESLSVHIPELQRVMSNNGQINPDECVYEFFKNRFNTIRAVTVGNELIAKVAKSLNL